MSEEIFRQTRKKIVPQGEEHPNEAAIPASPIAQTPPASPPMPPPVTPAPFNPFGDSGPKVTGQIPPHIQAMMQGKAPPPNLMPQPYVDVPTQHNTDMRITGSGSDQFELLMQKLNTQWEEIELPSCGKFYKGAIPGKLHVRPMTGAEEQILATQRLVKKGKAIDMIFSRCIQEQIDTTQLLSVDRNYILIYLRGISYTPKYDVEIKCPNCDATFSTIINLDEAIVESCPEDFTPDSLCGVLPSSGFKFTYRLSKGQDEFDVTNYREQKIEKFGDRAEDDTLIYRTALLIESIENVVDKREIQFLLKKLTINDVAHIRNTINFPPFGVDTEFDMLCPTCYHEFKIGLPLEASFFFPRKKETTTQAENLS